jgi:hypothetical protein
MRSMSICSMSANKKNLSQIQIQKTTFPLKIGSDQIHIVNKSEVLPEFEIERFEKEFIEPLSQLNRSKSFDTLTSTSDCSHDSGAFSRNTSPEQSMKFLLQEQVRGTNRCEMQSFAWFWLVWFWMVWVDLVLVGLG